ncbi:MAG: hypothetical protein GX442_23895 [Candidatus Riflebacteria bacterium]|nr:hypothetical protein [Candidatus Riflebacteria bacterium]
MQSSPSGSGIVTSVLILNVLWEMVQKIRAGSPSPVSGGNVRSIRYRLKPVFSRLGLIKDRVVYKNLFDSLAEMVSLKICSWKGCRTNAQYGDGSSGQTGCPPEAPGCDGARGRRLYSRPPAALIKRPHRT